MPTYYKFADVTNKQKDLEAKALIEALKEKVENKLGEPRYTTYIFPLSLPSLSPSLHPTSFHPFIPSSILQPILHPHPTHPTPISPINILMFFRVTKFKTVYPSTEDSECIRFIHLVLLPVTIRIFF
jgi:hypothetical protein